MAKLFQVIRTHVSPYQSTTFRDLEKRVVEGIPGCIYRQMEEALTDLPIILVTNTHTQLASIPPEILKNTKLIIHPNSGYDHFRHEVNLWKNIPLIIGHQIRAQAVAEYCLSCVFQGVTLLPQHLSWIPSRNWDRRLIKNLDVWLFGYGHIGKIIAQTLSSLGTNVTVIDPYISNCPLKHYKKWKEGNLRNADVIIAACGLNENSHHLFNSEFFSNTKPELLFINGARGKLVEENALKEHLLSTPKAFAFLDVFEEEPMNESWSHFPQVWKTSHIAGVHRDLDLEILKFEESVLNHFLKSDEQFFLNLYQNELLQNKNFQGVII